jgi:succinate dehydrogenase / fumarate reductase cytochrome b subunit
MSLTGLFLILFLVVHLAGNLQLLMNDGGEAFNLYAKKMTTNPLIMTISYLLYFFILLHAVQGIALWLQNRAARGGQRYAVSNTKSSSFASRNMAWLGIIIFVFIVIHMWQFWLQMKLGAVEKVQYAGYDYKVKDLYTPVVYAFQQWYFVVFYVFSMGVIAYHLLHGFQSAFQTLGINHKKYTPLIKTVGVIYSILIPLGFAIIPIYMFFFK